MKCLKKDKSGDMRKASCFIKAIYNKGFIKYIY